MLEVAGKGNLLVSCWGMYESFGGWLLVEGEGGEGRMSRFDECWAEMVWDVGTRYYFDLCRWIVRMNRRRRVDVG